MPKAYFKDIQQEIKTLLNQASSEIILAVAWFTDNELFEVLCRKASQGVKVIIAISDDEINNSLNGLDFNILRNKGGEIFKISVSGNGSLMHHKYCVLDRETTITGSYNWSRRASKNDENILVSKDSQLANSYYDEFINIVKRNNDLSIYLQFGKSLDTFRSQAENGDPESQNILGSLYCQGINMPADIPLGISFHEKAALQWNIKSLHILGFYHQTGFFYDKNKETAISYYKKASELGSVPSQYQLATIYANGDGVSKCFIRACRLYAEAANAGCSLSSEKIGMLFLLGDNVVQNFDNALYYLSLSEKNNGSGMASYYLGTMFLDGLGCEESIEQAEIHFHKARKCINIEYSIGQKYFNKTKKDNRKIFVKKSKYWLKSLAEQKDNPSGLVASAQYLLSFLYRESSTQKGDEEAEVHWLTLSAQRNNSDAQNDLGLCYAQGKGVKQSHSTATFWYIKSSKSGNINAKVALASHFAAGLGIKRDIDEAISLFTDAVNNGLKGSILSDVSKSLRQLKIEKEKKALKRKSIFSFFGGG